MCTNPASDSAVLSGEDQYLLTRAGVTSAELCIRSQLNAVMLTCFACA